MTLLMMPMRFLLLALLLSWTGSDCQEFAVRSVSVPATGITRVVIAGRAGYLRVRGRAGAREVRAEGEACAPIEHLLVGMRLTAMRKGNAIIIKAAVPDQKKSTFAARPKLDFTVTVPSNVEVAIGDTTGELKIANVGRVLIDKNGSGDIVATDIAGDLVLEKKPRGRVDYKRVRGTVIIPK